VSDKRYPTHPRGELDLGATSARVEPCARRITHESCADPTLRSAVTWCWLHAGHRGQCSGPPPRVIERNSFMPKGSK
jgi:hypothetical protein